ncbi:MAG: hypothetical protein JW966_00660 [Anaerolineae bacterium]|nr:hypothetical protein [Anaerolineae bacterium]
MSSVRALNVLFVHGIGWDSRGARYARQFEDMIRHEFAHVIRRLYLRDLPRGATQPQHALRFAAVHWAPVTQQPQNALLRLMFGRAGMLSRFNLTYQFRRNIIGMLGDVIAYERTPGNTVYGAIHATVEKNVQELSRASAGERDTAGCAPLTIVGHSLGSVIASDFVWDNTRSSGHSHRLVDHHLSLTNFVTMGSPMVVYALRNNAGGDRSSIQDTLDSPIRVDPDHGLWLNLYDRQDTVAFPLEPIDAYKAAGVIDRAINVGNWLTNWNLACHTGYWRSEDAARLVARKLALDWARLNSSRFAGRQFEKAAARYRKELREQ